METLLKDTIYLQPSFGLKSVAEEGDEYISDGDDMKEALAPKAFTEVVSEESKCKRKYKANPNVLQLNFEQLIKIASVPTGVPPLCCAKCKGVFNKHCSVRTDRGVWLCSFCKGPNKIIGPFDTKDYSNECVLYTEKDEGLSKNEEDIRFVFLIDKSGSMKGGKGLGGLSSIQVLNQLIIKEMTRLTATNKKSKVALILFNYKVTIIGDGTQMPLIINDDKHLYEPDIIRKMVSANPGLLSTPIESSSAKLIGAIDETDVQGMTAMGPAIIAGLELLRGGNIGSKMLIFTDGKATIGVGKLDQLEKEKNEQMDKKFYVTVGEEAREMGVEINLYRVAAEDCFADILYPMIKETNGELFLVDATQSVSKIQLPEDKKVLATNAIVRVVLPKLFKFRVFMEESALESHHVYVKKYGRILEDTTKRLQFGPQPSPSAKTDIIGLKEIPIQVSISFTSPAGKKQMVVLTKLFKIVKTKDGGINYGVITGYAQDIIEVDCRKDNLPIAESKLSDLLENYKGEESKDPELEMMVAYVNNLRIQVRAHIPGFTEQIARPSGERNEAHGEHVIYVIFTIIG